MAASTGARPSSAPTFSSVFWRKSSSSVVIPPSSDDSMSNGSAGDEPPKPSPDSGGIRAELASLGGGLNSAWGICCSFPEAECGEMIRTVFFTGLATSKYLLLAHTHRVLVMNNDEEPHTCIDGWLLSRCLV